jgi:hypothetical protein
VTDKRNPISLSELLAKGNPTLERLKQGVKAADAALVAVRHNLADDVRDHVWAATYAEGHLTLLVDAAGWATRVRYAVPALKTGVGAALGRPVEKVTVRVRPAGKA